VEAIRMIRRRWAWQVAGPLLLLAAAEQVGERLVPVPPLATSTDWLSRDSFGRGGTTIAFSMKPTTYIPAWRLVDVYRDELGLPPGDELRGESWRFTDGHLFRTYRQFHDGVPVGSGEITVSFRCVFIPVAESALGGFTTPPTRAKPTLSEARAIALAQAQVQTDGAGSISSSVSRLSFETLGNAIPEGRLIYTVTLETRSPVDTWSVWVDATTGDVLGANHARRRID
jgi:hypothetical protein